MVKKVKKVVHKNVKYQNNGNVIHHFELTYDDNSEMLFNLHFKNGALHFVSQQSKTKRNDTDGYMGEDITNWMRSLADEIKKHNGYTYNFQYNSDDGEFKGFLDDATSSDKFQELVELKIVFDSFFKKVDEFAWCHYNAYYMEQVEKIAKKGTSETDTSNYDEVMEQIADLFYFTGNMLATVGTLLCAAIVYTFVKPIQLIGELRAGEDFLSILDEYNYTSKM